jgi:hypothetical protein
LGKLVNDFGQAQIKALGYEKRGAFIQEELYLLKSYP